VFTPLVLGPRQLVDAEARISQAAYLSGWLARLRADRKLLIRAAAQAQRAADYVLNRKSSESV